MPDRVLSEEEETQLTPARGIGFPAVAEVKLPAAEKQQLGSEIKTLSKVATEQIDRMGQASTGPALLEQIRLHAETMVYQRADREIPAPRRDRGTASDRGSTAQTYRRGEAEAQTRQRAATAALELAEEEARRIAEQEEQRIEHLESIRRRAEASTMRGPKKERLLKLSAVGFR